MQGLHIGKYTLNDIFIERMLGYIRESNFIVHSVFNMYGFAENDLLKPTTSTTPKDKIALRTSIIYFN